MKQPSLRRRRDPRGVDPDRPRPRRYQRHHVDRGSRGARARGRRRQGVGRGAGQGLPGPALRRGQAELRPQAAQRRSPGRGRARARGRLAAAAHHAEPQPEDPARRRGLPRRLAHGADPGRSRRPGDARDGRRAPPGQPALLARSAQRAPHGQGDSGQADVAQPRATRPTSRSGTPTSTAGWRTPRSAGRRRWRRTRASRS